MEIQVISGFLGAGKTTFLNQYLPVLKGKTVVIENEFGDVGLDGELIQEDVPVREIYAGCICCSLALDFRKGIKELKEQFSPDQLVIEPSGVGRLSDIVQAVKDAYGENYLPSMEITEDMMSDIYGVNMDNVDEFIAEAPAISAHVDTFIAVKAKEGKGEEVEKELQAYLDYVVDNSINYPMNVAKVQSAKVVRYDDYVFYVMLGGYNDENPDATEEENVKFAQDQIQLGLDTIASFFEK